MISFKFSHRIGDLENIANDIEVFHRIGDLENVKNIIDISHRTGDLTKTPFSDEWGFCVLKTKERAFS